VAVPIGRIGHIEYSMWLFGISAWISARPFAVRTRLCPQHKTPPTRNTFFDTYSQALQCCFVVCFALHVYIKCHWMDQRWVSARSALLASPRALSSSRNDHCSPHPGPNQAEPPANFSLDILLLRVFMLIAFSVLGLMLEPPSRTAS